MVRRDYDPGSRFEDEGIPDLQDGTPEQQRAVDPQELPLPGDEPVAVDEFGTTVDEQIRGESLDGRLAREVPDVTEDPARERDPDETLDASADEYVPAGRLVADDEGAHSDEEKDSVASERGSDGGGFAPEERAMHIEQNG